jgi:branched-chain amino acid aminotransferase/para-aminobenzoate synthetase component 1
MTLPSPNQAQILWLNGRFLPVREASISPFDRGFLYGDGVFETMRAERGEVLYRQAHLERLRSSLEALRITADLSMDWDALFSDILGQNRLAREMGVVKVVVSRGVSAEGGTPYPEGPTICVTAQRYTPPEDDVYGKGWRVHVFREGFSPPLARHKTLNYLYFLTARQSALDARAHEALVLDPWGRITETSAGSILARTAGKWWTPVSPFQLSGITRGKVVELLNEAGEGVQEKQATLEELLHAQTVWVLNSLMGIMPVAEIDGRPVENPAAREAAVLREELFRPAPSALTALATPAGT